MIETKRVDQIHKISLLYVSTRSRKMVYAGKKAVEEGVKLLNILLKQLQNTKYLCLPLGIDTRNTKLLFCTKLNAWFVPTQSFEQSRKLRLLFQFFVQDGTPKISPPCDIIMSIEKQVGKFFFAFTFFCIGLENAKTGKLKVFFEKMQKRKINVWQNPDSKRGVTITRSVKERAFWEISKASMSVFPGEETKK